MFCHADSLLQWIVIFFQGDARKKGPSIITHLIISYLPQASFKVSDVPFPEEECSPSLGKGDLPPFEFFECASFWLQFSSTIGPSPSPLPSFRGMFIFYSTAGNMCILYWHWFRRIAHKYQLFVSYSNNSYLFSGAADFSNFRYSFFLRFPCVRVSMQSGSSWPISPRFAPWSGLLYGFVRMWL